jgi:hypothetical protein
MKEIKGKSEKVWAIAHNADTTFHPIELQAGLTLSTGQPFLEEFETEEEMVARLTELTGDPAFWDKLKQDNSLSEELDENDPI